MDGWHAIPKIFTDALDRIARSTVSKAELTSQC